MKRFFGVREMSLAFDEQKKMELTVDPEIYFDEKEEEYEQDERKKVPGNDHTFYTVSHAVFLLDSMERILDLVHSGKELKILRMRLAGKSYREIASSLHIGLASINRLIRRISLRNAQVGFLLENAQYLQEKRLR